MISNVKSRILAILFLSSPLFTPPLFAASGTWIRVVNLSGPWGLAANWQGGIIANGVGDTATFPQTSVGTGLVSTAAFAPTIGTWAFSTTGKSYVFSGGNPITLSVLAGSAAITTSATTGGVTINCPVILTSSTIITHASGSTLSINADISGAGACTLNGTGTVVFTGTNSYQGITTVSSGTLRGDSLSLPTNIVNAASLIFNQTSSGTFANTISGSGNLTVQGGGTLTLTNQCTQNTATVVSGGILSVNGTFSCTALSTGMTVNAGGILKGTGSIVGNVLNNGTLAPGNSIGTLTIEGDYTQGNGSTLQIEFNPTSADALIVNGSFHMGSNTTLSLLPSMGIYRPLTTYIIIQANDGITYFTNTTISLPSFSYTIRAHPNYMRLIINLVPFSSLVSGDALLVARCLDGLSPPDGSDLAIIIESLQAMQIPEMESTMLQMLPTLFNGLDLDQETILLQVRNTLSREMNLMCNNGCRNLRSWRVWSDLFKNYSYQDSQGTRVGYKSQPIGEVIGIDKQVAPNVFVGGSASYAQDNLEWYQNDGNAFLQGGYGALYAGGWLLPSFYMQGALVGAINHYTTQRVINFTGDQFSTFERIAEGDFFGFSLLPHLETGCSFTRNVWRTRGFVKADYAFIHRTTFQETNADTLNLRVQSHNADLLRFELGVELLRCFPIRTVTLSPYVSMGVVSENRFLGKKETASLVGLHCSMEPAGIFPNRRLFFLETGFLHQCFYDRVFLGADFRGEWQKEYTSLSWSLQLKYNF